MVTVKRQNKPTVPFFDIVNIVLLVFVTLLMLYPFIYMLAVSLSDSAYVLRNEITLWPKGVNTKAYQLVFNDPAILSGYRNTIVYTVLGTFIALVLTACTAYSLARKDLVFRKVFTLLIVFTMVFGGGMIPTFLVVKSLGMIDTVWAMVLPGAISTWNVFVMMTFFQGIPKELEESGTIDGLSPLGILTRIILPLSKPVMATIGLFVAVGLWNNYYYPLLYLRSLNMYPLQVIIRNLLETGLLNSTPGSRTIQKVDQSLKFATIIVGTLPILMVYPFIQKHFVKGVLIGSVKG